MLRLTLLYTVYLKIYTCTSLDHFDEKKEMFLKITSKVYLTSCENNDLL